MGLRRYLLCSVLLACGLPLGAELRPKTSQAFDQYVRQTEQRLDARKTAADFLWTDERSDRRSRVQQGEVVVEPFAKGPAAEVSVPDGLIHDWMGAVFIPGAKISQVLALVQDYDRHKQVYKPEVVDSRLVGRKGEEFQVYLRLVKKKVLTVVLDTYHEVHYFQVDASRWYSRSASTRISEVENAGKADERVLPPGEGHGFLWRLNSYWRFQERDGGVYVECEAISLTRAIPVGLGWMIQPIIRSLPRDSLIHTLEATRSALTGASDRSGK